MLSLVSYKVVFFMHENMQCMLPLYYGMIKEILSRHLAGLVVNQWRSFGPIMQKLSIVDPLLS